jgi:hypothetical protein
MSILKVNTIQDRGGNTIISSDGSGTITPNGFGKIGQVIQSTTSTNITTTGGAFVTSNLAVAITPTSTSSKIYLVVSAIGQINTNGICLDIHRSTTSTFLSGGLSRGLVMVEALEKGMPMPISILDAPSTNSAITYTIYFKNTSGGTASLFRGDVLSTFVAMEVLA